MSRSPVSAIPPKANTKFTHPTEDNRPIARPGTDVHFHAIRHNMAGEGWCRFIFNKSTYIAENFILATGKVLLSSPPKSFDSSKKIFETLSKIIEPGHPTDSRRLALVISRTLSRTNMDMVRPHVPLLAPPIFSSVRDPVIPVKLAAEAAFVELFCVADEESRVFDKFMAGPEADMSPNTKRSMSDYFKRVAMRLGAQAKERREAEGGQGGLGLSNDEQEDEKEIWSVGKVEVVGESFS